MGPCWTKPFWIDIVQAALPQGIVENCCCCCCCLTVDTTFQYHPSCSYQGYWLPWLYEEDSNWPSVSQVLPTLENCCNFCCCDCCYLCCCFHCFRCCCCCYGIFVPIFKVKGGQIHKNALCSFEPGLVAVDGAGLGQKCNGYLKVETTTTKTIFWKCSGKRRQI